MQRAGMSAVGSLAGLMVVTAGAAHTADAAQEMPNIVIINIDDMGWGDIGAYGSRFSQTPRMDKLAEEGTRFTQFYSGAPICSPSRAAMFTGRYAARSNITSYIDNSEYNLARDNADFLSLDAPSMARTFKEGGYTTGHFGKWHLGGGRDVGYAKNPTPGTNVAAPRMVEYGYDVVWTQFEGIGNRIVNVVDYADDYDTPKKEGLKERPSNYLNGLNRATDERGTGGGLDDLVYLEREYNSAFMVDHAIDFISDVERESPDEPFFMNVWFDEVHTPHDPPPELKKKYDGLYPDLPQESRNYLAVMEEMDTQIGRLVDHLDSMGLGDETLILVTADNGAEDLNVAHIGSAGPFRGAKRQMFEGGFREPLIARWTGHVKAGRTDTDTVIWGPDLLPTLSAVAGITGPDASMIDGEDLHEALLGKRSVEREGVLFWNMNRAAESRHSNPHKGGAGDEGREILGIRKGDWKLLVNADGTAPELYDLAHDVRETHNLASSRPEQVRELTELALTIRYDVPSRNVPVDFARPVVRLKAGEHTYLSGDDQVRSWKDMTGPNDGFAGGEELTRADAFPTLKPESLNGKPVVVFQKGVSLGAPSTVRFENSPDGVTLITVARAAGSDEASVPVAEFRNGKIGIHVPTDNRWHVVVCVADSDGTVTETCIDGTMTRLSDYASTHGNPTDHVLRIGSLSDTGEAGKVGIAELMIVNEALSVRAINLVGTYLSTEYGLEFEYDLVENGSR